MSFLRNAWYLAAWQHEIPADAALARRYLDEPVVMFRKRDGTPIAIGGRCPHRFAPLHLGKIKDGVLECPYHGLQFDETGACVHNPHEAGRIPKAAKVEAYPVIERHHGVWIWMGERDKADPAKLPDCSELDLYPQESFLAGYLPTNCNYELLTDNILDLTHADYVHPDTFGDGLITNNPGKFWEEGDQIFHYWWMPNAPTLPALAARLPDPAALCDTWNEVRWDAPAVMRLEAGCVPAGRPRTDAQNTFAYHIMTPETQTTTHYFYAAVRNFDVHEQVNQYIRKVMDQAFVQEDKPILEAQQKLMGTSDLWSLDPVLLPSDIAGVRARRKLAAMIAREKVSRA